MSSSSPTTPAYTKMEKLVLRCYGYRTPHNTWALKCIDLNLVAEEPTLEEAKRYLSDTIHTYLDAVMDTEDRASIPHLLMRKAPAKDILAYHLAKMCRIKTRHVFDEIIPVRLGLA